MQYVRAGRAVWDGDRLRFLTSPEEIVEHQRQERLHIAEAEKLWDENHGARMAWNGSDPDPLATHKPGEVRS